MAILNGGLVFHNTPEEGEHLDSPEVALKGLPASRWDIASEHQAAAHMRLMAVIRNPQPYHALNNNCQHTVSRIVTGVAQSPTLQGVAFWLGIGGVGMLVCQSERRSR